MSAKPLLCALALLMLAAPNTSLAKKPKRAGRKAAPAAQAAQDPAPAEAEQASQTLADDLPDADKACNQELAGPCKGIAPGDQRIASCLRQHKDTLGESCKKALYGFLKQRFEVGCRDDVKKLCPGATGGKMMGCLNQHIGSLGAMCKYVMGLGPKPGAAPAQTADASAGSQPAKPAAPGGFTAPIPLQ